MIVFLSFVRHTYFFDNCTSQNIYLFVRQFSSTIVRAFFITVRETIWNTYVYTSNWFIVFARVINIIYFICFIIFFRICTSIFITVRDIWRNHTRLHVKSTRLFLFRSEDFSTRSISILLRFFIMKVFIFAIFTDDTTSILFSLKSLFTYEKRLASLLIIRFYFSATRRFHFKTIMIVVDFSEKNSSTDSNVIECLICFLRLYTKYYIFKSLKKHFRNASHCSLAQQFQQKVESKKIAESKNIVEKSKIESSFVFVFLVKLLDTYENRLASLDKWRNVDSKNVLIVAEFSDIDICYKTQCTHCSIELFDVDREEKSLKYHFRKSFECSLVLQLEKKISEVIVEIAKFISVVADIDFFDAIFLCDIQKFSLFCEIASFVQRFRQCQHQYRESNVLILLFDCLRDSALIWYKQQNKLEIEIVKKNLSEWLKVLIIAFSSKSFAKSSIQIFFFVSFASHFSSQYHFCLNCFAFFSSLIRFLQHIQNVICQKIVCKQCEEIFESKNKLHEHIRQHHVKSTKKMIKDVSKRNFNREKDKISSTISNISSRISTISTTKFSISRFVTLSESKFSISRSVTFSESSRIASFAFSFISFVIFATIASTTSSKRSRFSLFTSKSASKRAKITSKFVKIASDCSSTSFATFTSKFRKSISKFYFTIHDLHRMFVEKSRSFDLRQHQNRRSFSQSFESRQFDRSNSFYQFRIIAYFLSAVNQKTSISQSLKSSNSKNFQQFTFAKSFSFCHRFAFALSKKSIFSSYKNSNIFYISLQSKFSFLQSKFSFAWSRFTFSFTFSSFFRFSSLFEFSLSDFYVYCICFDHFSFRNDSFNYRRFNQRYFSNRRSIEERNSRFETKFAEKKK